MGKPTLLGSDLLEIDVLKLGEFVLKSKNVSPFYIDLRHVICYPKVLNAIVRDIFSVYKASQIQADYVCGVPYNGIPIASVLCSTYEIPMLLQRKETKSYGTKKMIEGIINIGSTCLIIEDVVVSGSSILETAKILRKEGLVVTDCITVFDRLQGGKKNLSKAGIRLHSLLDIHGLFNQYRQIHDVDDSMVKKVEKYLIENVCDLDVESLMNEQKNGE